MSAPDLTFGSRSPTRLGAIDGLRFFAILLVMLHHYLPEHHFALFGQGVVLFFVLSGYFATRQLLRGKRSVVDGTLSRTAAIRAFHVRRYLRIFPVYFAVLALAVLADVPFARESWGWHAGFLSNWYALVRLDWMGSFSPFWSLALLEQFYLFWPTLLVCLPRRAELHVALGLIAIAVLWRVYCHLHDLNGFYWLVFPVAGWDQLGFGVLLALAQERGREAWRRRLRTIGLYVAGPLAAYLVAFSDRDGFGALHYVYEPTVVAAFLVWSIDRAAVGLPGWIDAVLQHSWIRAGGRMSYGMFACHEFTKYLIAPVAHPAVASFLGTEWRALLLVPGTVLLAAAAFVVIERPFYRLKTFFPLAPPGGVMPQVVPLR